MQYWLAWIPKVFLQRGPKRDGGGLPLALPRCGRGLLWALGSPWGAASSCFALIRLPNAISGTEVDLPRGAASHKKGDWMGYLRDGADVLLGGLGLARVGVSVRVRACVKEAWLGLGLGQELVLGEELVLGLGVG